MLILRGLFAIVFRRYEPPHFILMQPKRVGISSDEFIDRQALDQLRAQNPFLFSIDEDRHEFLFPLPSGTFLSCGQLAYRFLAHWNGQSLFVAQKC